MWQSFGYAFQGLGYALRTQRNARIHLVVGVVIAVLTLWLKLDAVRCAILAMMIGGVMVGELINTSLEAVVDLLMPEYHARAKIAKDVAAAAVLWLAITALVVGGLLLGPPLWSRLQDLSSRSAKITGQKGCCVAAAFLCP